MKYWVCCICEQLNIFTDNLFVDVLEEMYLYIFDGLNERFSTEIEAGVRFVTTTLNLFSLSICSSPTVPIRRFEVPTTFSPIDMARYH